MDISISDLRSKTCAKGYSSIVVEVIKMERVDAVGTEQTGNNERVNDVTLRYYYPQLEKKSDSIVDASHGYKTHERPINS